MSSLISYGRDHHIVRDVGKPDQAVSVLLCPSASIVEACDVRSSSGKVSAFKVKRYGSLPAIHAVR